MSAMKEEVYGEAIIDTVKSETLVSDPVIIKVSEMDHGDEDSFLCRHPSLFTNQLPTFFVWHVGYLPSRRATTATQLPVTFHTRVHIDKTH